MESKKCEPKCKFRNIKYLAEKASPEYPDDGTASYSLIGCKICGSLMELRQGIEADRWGSAETVEVEVDYQYAKENYGMNEAEIREKLGLP
ncbi:hypothetical protein ACUY1T_21750 [Billgrantia sp. Q4P2]|uniref:hypothetical protein n=1 Tax=Billgrantia sp. Q4P2 TaxID=3463857 RepID=UPI004057C576